MDRITRKDLKTDKFALEVEHTVEYVSEHRKQAIRYTAAALVVIAVASVIYVYRGRQHDRRQEALTAAMRIMDADIGPADAAKLTFPTEAEKDKAATKAFASLAAEHAGTSEGIVARYYLGVVAADAGNSAEAEKSLRAVAESSDANYASLAKLSLAEIYQSQGKIAEGEKLLRSLVEKPTLFVSKEQATLALGRLLASTKPAEARKLLEPLRTARGAISRSAIVALSEMPAK